MRPKRQTNPVNAKTQRAARTRALVASWSRLVPRASIEMCSRYIVVTRSWWSWTEITVHGSRIRILRLAACGCAGGAPASGVPSSGDASGSATWRRASSGVRTVLLISDTCCAIYHLLTAVSPSIAFSSSSMLMLRDAPHSPHTRATRRSPGAGSTADPSATPLRPPRPEHHFELRPLPPTPHPTPIPGSPHRPEALLQ